MAQMAQAGSSMLRNAFANIRAWGLRVVHALTPSRATLIRLLKILVLVAVIVVPVKFVLPPALGIVGFSAAGPTLGGMAAGIQSGIGNVAAGSLFSGLQSIAMGGPIAAEIYAAAAAIGATLGFFI